MDTLSQISVENFQKILLIADLFNTLMNQFMFQGTSEKYCVKTFSNSAIATTKFYWH